MRDEHSFTLPTDRRAKAALKCPPVMLGSAAAAYAIRA
jgi:hypothetical protein